jgi:hypothetical protein
MGVAAPGRSSRRARVEESQVANEFLLPAPYSVQQIIIFAHI